jgi:hypothetical protein
MNISKWNEEVEAYLNSSYLGMVGDVDFNRSRVSVFKYLINNMQKRTLGMFEYKNLPETLSARSIEKYLQGSGTCLIVDVKQEQITNQHAIDDGAKPGLYALPCKAGGVLNADYLPTRAIVVSAYLGLSGEYDLMKKEAVYMWNDSLLEGLAPLYSLYASELTDNVLTLHFQEVHNRILSIIKASTEDEKKDAKDFFKDYENGVFAALMNEDFLDNLQNNRVDPFKGSNNSTIKDTLEARQWLLAHWNIEIGLNDNYNMKREALNENEIEANADTLTPLLDDMYKCRKRGVEEINKIFGTNIEVDFSSSWKRVHKREQNAQKQEDLEIEALKKQVEETSTDDVKNLQEDGNKEEK